MDNHIEELRFQTEEMKQAVERAKEILS